MFKNKKIKYIEFLPIIIITLFSYKFINNFEHIANTLLAFLPSIATIFWGLAIAYFLNFPLSFIEQKLKLHRILSIILVYTILFGFIAAFFTSLIPQITSSIKDLINLLPTEDEIQSILTSLQSIGEMDFLKNIDITDHLSKILTTMTSTFKNSFNSILSGLNVTFSTFMSIATSFFKFAFGLIIAAYMLKDKEKLTSYTNNALKSLMSEKKYDTLIFNLKEIHEVFSKYIVGKSLDSFIIGVLCIIGLTLMNIEYALLIGLIVGVTNMIPYFGPFIGMIPASLIALLSTGQFSKGFAVLIFVIILQQLDGWLIGPKILGDSVGLDPLVVITAIIIGGATFGLVGMFVSVPIVAILRANFERFISKQAKKNNTEITE